MAKWRGIYEEEKRDRELAIVYYSVAALFSLVGGGWALMLLWGWFVVPALGAPVLTYAEAVGIGLLVDLLTVRADRGESNLRHAKKVAARACEYPLIAVGIGWIVTLFL